MSAAESTTSDPTPEPSRHYILGTAGHIDHGKTSLVRALTGTDTDRLPEERRRGMTIELGFAEFVVDDMRFGVVDVPGHERFVRTMVAGATGIDIALIVVAADDSVMPQTVEHVEILNLLGVERAVVAVTKIDTVDEEMVELVIDDVEQLLAGTPLADAPVLPVSSITGQGIGDLREAVATVARGLGGGPTGLPFRMAVDRVFTMAGRGTVVTGSTLRGTVTSGDVLQVWPGGKTCRVRDLQTHGAVFSHISVSQRAAINISGLDKDEIRRGAQIATPGYLEPSHLIDVKLHCLESCGKEIKSASTVRLAVGTAEIAVRVVFLDNRALGLGQRAFAQLRSGTPIATTHGQRFIIRDETAARTIGGGIVLRPVARRRRLGDVAAEKAALERLATGDDLDRMEDVLRRARFERPTDLALAARAGVELDAIPGVLSSLEDGGRWTVLPGTEVRATPAAVDDLIARLVRWLERHHRSEPDSPGRHSDAALGWLERMADRSVARAIFELAIERKLVKRLGQYVCATAFAPELSAGDEKVLHAMVSEIRRGGFSPPAPEATSAAKNTDRKRRDRLIQLAVATSDLVKIDAKIFLHVDVERELRSIVARMIAKQGTVTVADVREGTGSSRKYVVPFMEYLDRVGFTRREGDARRLVDP